jgi:hypothetical protein
MHPENEGVAVERSDGRQFDHILFAKTQTYTNAPTAVPGICVAQGTA